ncbi:MAG: DUF805 domain-containing protein [Maricaulaceae bacterium]|jgi:uncharacterized membrane protein YhaH (DUF805 family)
MVEATSARRPYPAAAYLGPMFLALIIGSSIGMATSTVMALLPMHLVIEYGRTPVDVSQDLAAVGLGVGTLTLIIQIFAAYFCYRGAMAWFAFLMTPSGRASRADYWLKYWLPFFALSFLVFVPLVVVTASLIPVMVNTAGPADLWPIALGQALSHSILIDILLIWPAFCVLAKRLHDRGKSAWFLLILLIPIVGAIWMFIEVALLPGQRGENRHGPDPREIAA